MLTELRRELYREATTQLERDVFKGTRWMLLKRMDILHRKNALFYKTRNGARVGDLFMSLIYTCEVNQANPFDYLTQLQQHPDQLAASPQLWMPWNYRDALP